MMETAPQSGACLGENVLWRWDLACPHLYSPYRPPPTFHIRKQDSAPVPRQQSWLEQDSNPSSTTGEQLWGPGL